jgi:hypothetical protein
LTVQEQIAKLESLLDRIRRNAGKPRSAVASVVAAAAPVVAPAPAPQMAKPEPVVVPSPPPAPVAEAPVLEVEAASAAEIEDLDMMDVEIVEIAVESPTVAEPEERAPMQTLVDDPPDTVDEPIPESAPRPAAALAAEAEIEAPITPPPESGRQAVAVTSYDEAPREAELGGGSDVDSLLEADLSGSPISRAPSAGGPTMEQLGETVELEGADAPAANLELDSAPPAALESAPDELELDLPKQKFAAGYDTSLSVPEMAAIEAPPVQAPAFTAAPAVPTIVARPAVDTIAAEVIAAAPAKVPETFIDLLDASLALKA